MPFKKPHQTADPTKKDGSPDDGYTIKPKGLNIVWGNDPRYWSITENGSAGLIQVSWLEVSGLVPVTPGKKYRVTFEVSLKPDSFGWNGSPVLIMAKIGKRGDYNYKEVTLDQPGKFIIPSNDSGLEIQVPANAPDRNLHFGLYEVWSGKWKGGLEIHKAIIQPFV